jgi:hypothetical protein
MKREIQHKGRKDHGGQENAAAKNQQGPACDIFYDSGVSQWLKIKNPFWIKEGILNER